MHQDFLRNAPGLLQSNAISTFKPTEPPSKGHLKFKLNNLHQKWSFCLDHFGITLDLPASNLLFAKPFWLPTHWFWASNFPSFRRLWKQCSRWCRTATRRQKSNTRRSKSASSNGDWQEIMDSMHEFCWEFCSSNLLHRIWNWSSHQIPWSPLLSPMISEANGNHPRTSLA